MLFRQVAIVLSVALLTAASLSAFDRKNYYVTDASYRSYTEFVRGVRFYNEERFEASAESFRASLDFDPYDDLAAAWYSRALLKTGRVEEALAALQNLERMGNANALIESKIDRISRTPRAPSARGVFHDFVYLRGFSDNPQFVRHIGQPIDLLIDNENSLYLLDYLAGAILKFNANGELAATISRAADPGLIENVTGVFDRFEKPRAINFDPDGNILVADTGNDRVFKISPDGVRLVAIGGAGSSNGAFYNPSGVASGPDYKIYVADTANNRVQIFSPEGEYLWKFGSLGDSDGEFFRPSGILVHDGEIYVADTGNQRIQIFDEYGVYRRSITNPAFMRPRGLKLARDGGLYITDERRVFHYTMTTGEFRAFDASTEYSLTPMGVAEGTDGSIYVADFSQTDVDVYQPKTRLYANVDITLDRTLTGAFPMLVQRVSVRDDSGAPLVGLRPHNFYATDNGVAPQAIAFYEHADMQSRRFVFLVDKSAAAGDRRVELENEIAAFVATLAGDDEALVIRYNDRVDVHGGGFLKQNSRILAAAASDAYKGGNAAFSEALFEAARRSAQSYKPTAIVVFSASDVGEDAFAFRPYDVIAEHLRANFYPVTAVEIGTQAENYFLREIARHTMGRNLSSLVTIDYANEMDYLRSLDRGVYYLAYNVDRKSRPREKYRFATVGVSYREMTGEDASGYLVP